MILPSPKAPWSDAAFLRTVHIAPMEDGTTEMLRAEFARAEKAAQAERDRINRSRGFAAAVLSAILFSICMFAFIWFWAAA